MYEKRPYVCPVCDGRGVVPFGFYLTLTGYWTTSTINTETCRTCGRTGIVWNNKNTIIINYEERRFETNVSETDR